MEYNSGRVSPRLMGQNDSSKLSHIVIEQVPEKFQVLAMNGVVESTATLNNYSHQLKDSITHLNFDVI